MIISPRIKDFICLTAHPDGCEEAVREQIQYIKQQPSLNTGKRTLIVGSSTGYGLSSRICAAWGDQAPTIGVCYEKPSDGRRTATPGWYNTAAFEKFAHQDGLYAKTINGDAYSREVKQAAASLIREDLKQIDLLIYSVAAPRRAMPDGTVRSSVLKTVGEPFTGKSLDLNNRTLTERTILPANSQEIADTIAVMGGEDWEEWIRVLKQEGLLSEQFSTIAYSYIGPEMTYPIYTEGTIGQAKKHLYDTAVRLQSQDIPAYVSVNKAVVTQSSSAIPIVPLYISILYKVMKERGIHENTIEQMYRLWSTHLTSGQPAVDLPCRIRLDDLEMLPEVQETVRQSWDLVTNSTLTEYADIEGYWEDFYHLFGFGFEGVDYDADVSVERTFDAYNVL